MSGGVKPASHSGTTSKQHLRLWLRLLKLTRDVEGELRERMRVEFGSTLPRFDVMAALGRNPAGLRMSELSSVLRVSNGNVTGIVDRLVEGGLVIRVPVPGDRRASQVRLTRRGEEEFARQAKAHEAWVDDLLAPFGANEAADLTERLAEAITRAEQEDRKP